MRKSPKQTAEKLQRIISAWETLRPAKTFGGMTLEQFKARVQPSLDERVSLTTLRSQVTESREKRRQNDDASLAAALLVVRGVQADPQETEDGPLYTAMGYVPKGKRQSGLYRSGQATPPAQTAAA